MALSRDSFKRRRLGLTAFTAGRLPIGRPCPANRLAGVAQGLDIRAGYEVAMARLFLVRHGEPKATWGGAEADPGLSDLGRAQAEAAASALALLGRFNIVSSPLQRARQTAAATARLLGGSIAIEPRIGEIAAPPQIEDRRAWLQALMRPGLGWRDADPALRAWRADLLAAIGEISEDVAMFSHFVAINVVTGAACGRDAIGVCTPALASISEFVVEPAGIRLISGAPFAGEASAT